MSDEDFSIVLGDRTFRFSSKILVEKSGYFRALHNGPWQESQQKSVTLQGWNPWDIARMLQFLLGQTYTMGNRPSYEFVTHHIWRSAISEEEEEISLKDIIAASSEQLISYNEIEIENSRTKRDINLAMFEIGKYFDVLSLREYIASFLVTFGFDGYHFGYRGHNSTTQSFTKAFCEIYELLEPFLGESEEMRQQETRLVAKFLTAKIETIKPGRNKGIPYHGCHTSLDDLRDLELKVEEYAATNDRVALKLAKAYSNCLDITASQLSWTKRALEACKDFRL